MKKRYNSQKVREIKNNKSLWIIYLKLKECLNIIILYLEYEKNIKSKTKIDLYCYNYLLKF